jgi:hypothetical protein
MAEQHMPFVVVFVVGFWVFIVHTTKSAQLTTKQHPNFHDLKTNKLLDH